MAAVVAFAVPLWQILFVNTPQLSVEISEIRRKITPDAVVSVEDDPELRILIPPKTSSSDWGGDRYDRAKQSAYKVEELDEMLKDAKLQLKTLPTVIEEQKRDVERVEAITPTNFSRADAARLNAPLWPEIPYDRDQPAAGHAAFLQNFCERLVESERRYAEFQTGIPVAERKIQLLRQQLLANRSYFTVSTFLINSGRSNTAVKVPGLLRVYIGEGNYIDIKLTIRDFEDKSEIPSSGTRIAIFESAEVSTLPEEDRNLINTYWGQSVRSRLFLEDIHGVALCSNVIAFAEGLYQKMIYDRLARAAGNANSRK